MDVDDVEGKLAQQLSCMGTNDREVLIRQFQQVLGLDHEITPESCAFFLDMNNWNLQAALGSYYDFGGSGASNVNGIPLQFSTNLPKMEFVQDVTIGEGESIPPNTRFTKTWRVRNSGEQAWPANTWLRLQEGSLLTASNEISVPTLEPGAQTDISVDMMSPNDKGTYQSRWQLITSYGLPFGEPIWCIIVVEDCGLLGITQQLANVSAVDNTEMSQPSSSQQQQQPFSSFNFQSSSSPNKKDDATATTAVSFSTASVSLTCSTPTKSTDLTTSSSACGTSRQSSEQSLLDTSLRAVHGSPTPNSSISSQTQSMFDAPASPNGSTRIHEMVAQSGMTVDNVKSDFMNNLHNALSRPVSIPTQDMNAPGISWSSKFGLSYNAPDSPDNQAPSCSTGPSTPHHRRQPVVPPGTPNTPPGFPGHFGVVSGGSDPVVLPVPQTIHNLDSNLIHQTQTDNTTGVFVTNSSAAAMTGSEDALMQ